MLFNEDIDNIDNISEAICNFNNEIILKKIFSVIFIMSGAGSRLTDLESALQE